MSNYVDCKIAHLTPEQLLTALLTKNADGEWALRTMIVDGCAENAIGCDQSALPMDVMIKKLIGIDPVCGKPAIRLASDATNLLTAVKTYADDAAAAAGSPVVPVGGIYNKTGVGLVARVA